MITCDQDISKMVVVNNETGEQIIGIISRPGNGMHAAANRMNTLNAVLADLDKQGTPVEVGMYHFLHFSDVSKTLRRRTQSFSIYEVGN